MEGIFTLQIGGDTHKDRRKLLLSLCQCFMVGRGWGLFFCKEFWARKLSENI